MSGARNSRGGDEVSRLRNEGKGGIRGSAMKGRIVFFAGLGLLAATATARVEWIEKDHDFGLMKEVLGPQTGVSRFVNLGPDTISIFNVRPSCGCTSADWSDAPVAPGDTARIAYTYDPHMRPGKFDKSVKVQLSDGSRHSIRITGNVYGTPESVSSIFPFDAGDLRLSDVAVNMGNVRYGNLPIAFVTAYNLSADSVSPEVRTDIAGLTVSPSVPTAGPGDLITYTITLDTRKAGLYGPAEGEISFITPAGEGRPLPFRAFVEPDPERLATQQQGKNPVIEVSPDPIDLGSIDTAGGRVTAELNIRNSGKGPLEIYRIVCQSKGVSVSGVPEKVKAGKSNRIKITADPAELPQGPSRVPLQIITNDPLTPVRTVNVAFYRP